MSSQVGSLSVRRVNLACQPATDPARKFLRDSRLVRNFETRSILEHVHAMLAGTRAQRVAQDALTFVFNLSRSGAPIETDLACDCRQLAAGG